MSWRPHSALRLCQQLGRSAVKQVMPASHVLERSKPVAATRVRSAIRVISLPGAADRRRLFSHANQSLGPLNWEFFPASQGREPSITYSENAAIREFGRPMTGPELGCYQSHVNLWRWFLSSDLDQLFVFEDDAVVDAIMLARLYETNMQAMGIDVLRLYSTHSVRMKLVSELVLSSHSRLFQARGMIFGTQAYCITRKAAQALLAISSPVTQPVDWLMMRYWRYGFANFIIFPHPVFEFQGPSSIDTSACPLPSRAQKLAKMRRTLRDKAMREWADRISFASVVKTAKIAIDKERRNLSRA